jgi:hypothetical protein
MAFRGLRPVIISLSGWAPSRPPPGNQELACCTRHLLLEHDLFLSRHVFNTVFPPAKRRRTVFSFNFVSARERGLWGVLSVFTKTEARNDSTAQWSLFWSIFYLVRFFTRTFERSHFIHILLTVSVSHLLISHVVILTYLFLLAGFDSMSHVNSENDMTDACHVWYIQTDDGVTEQWARIEVLNYEKCQFYRTRRTCTIISIGWLVAQDHKVHNPQMGIWDSK